MSDVGKFRRLYESRAASAQLGPLGVPFRFSCNDIIIHDTQLYAGDLLSDLLGGTKGE